MDASEVLIKGYNDVGGGDPAPVSRNSDSGRGNSGCSIDDFYDV